MGELPSPSLAGVQSRPGAASGVARFRDRIESVRLMRHHTGAIILWPRRRNDRGARIFHFRGDLRSPRAA